MSLKLIQRKGSANWYIRGAVRGQPVFESTGTHDRAAAETIRIKREAEVLETTIHGKVATATFLEAAVSYLAGGGSARFVGKETSGRWTGLIGHFGTRRLASITQDDLDRAARVLYPDSGPETRNRQCHTPFIAIWNHAVKNRYAEQREWSRPRQVKGTAAKPITKRAGTRPTTYDRAVQFVSAMSPAPGLVMTALFYTGMRPIELFSLDADEDDIRVDDRWLVLSGSKTGAQRGVPIHEFLVPIFRALVARGGRLFRTPRGAPYPLTEDGGGQMKTAIDGARRRTGIVDISPYTARHTVSTQLVVAGVHAYIKDQILGHAVTDMSRRYVSVPQAPLIEAINVLPVPPAWREIEWIAHPLTGPRLVRWGQFRAKSEHPIKEQPQGIRKTS